MHNTLAIGHKIRRIVPTKLHSLIHANLNPPHPQK